MVGLICCILAFVASLLLAWRSVAGGLCAVLTVGYGFGIVRANFPDTYSHFIFDSAVLGFFLSYFGGGGIKTLLDPSQQAIQRWAFLLIGWTVLMFLIPMQHPLIQLVGLRGNAFLLPFILVGGSLNRDDAIVLALWAALLNFVAFGFALPEYFLGVQMFYPENTVTEIIYKSNDVAGYTAMRIPATFSNAHSFGGTMLLTVPWLLGAWTQPRLIDWQRMLLISATAVAMVGIFLCGARMPAVLLGVIGVFATFSGQMRTTVWLVWALLILGIVYVVGSEDRLQRFTTLQDTEMVYDRIKGSVNVAFLDLLLEFPFGNGLGAGGTSIPYFLHELVDKPMFVENEYARILLEQGLAGLALWIAFIIWFLGRRPSDVRDPWRFGKMLLWCISLASFAAGVIGVGLLTSIPGSMLFLLGVGFVTAPAKIGEASRPRSRPTEKSQSARAPVTEIASVKP
jgi:hypothetical protein